MNDKLCLCAMVGGFVLNVTLKDAVAIASGIVSIIAGICAIRYYWRKGNSE